MRIVFTRAAVVLVSLCLFLQCVRSHAAPTRPPQAQGPGRVLKILPAGRYHGVIAGILCNACTHAIVQELKAISGIQEVSFDFEEGLLHLTVRKGHKVRIGKIERALRLAARRVDLDVHFSLSRLEQAS